MQCSGSEGAGAAPRLPKGTQGTAWEAPVCFVHVWGLWNLRQEQDKQPTNPSGWKWSCSGLHAAQPGSSVSCKGLRVAEHITPVLKTAWAPLLIAWLWNASLLSTSRFSHLTRLELKYLNFSEVNMKFHWNRHLPWHYFPELKMYQQQIFFPYIFLLKWFQFIANLEEQKCSEDSRRAAEMN